MPYTYDIEPAALFEDRGGQMLTCGIPQEGIKGLREKVREWIDAPGGWVYEWSAVAARYASSGNPTLSAVAYGWAKFPCLANEASAKALQLQVEQYVEASQNFCGEVRASKYFRAL